MKHVILLLAVIQAASVTAFAQSAVFIVRHAERADAGMTPAPGADPDLSAAGIARAEALGAMLKDAGIGRIYVTEFKRTRQTAEPLAARLGLELTVVASKDTAGLVEGVKGSSGNILIVGHSNTVPEILMALGAGEGIAIGDSEYDNLFVLIRGASLSLVRLRYR